MSEKAPKPEDLNPTNRVEITGQEKDYMTDDQLGASIDRNMEARRAASARTAEAQKKPSTHEIAMAELAHDNAMREGTVRMNGYVDYVRQAKAAGEADPHKFALEALERDVAIREGRVSPDGYTDKLHQAKAGGADNQQK